MCAFIVLCVWIYVCLLFICVSLCLLLLFFSSSIHLSSSLFSRRHVKQVYNKWGVTKPAKIFTLHRNVDIRRVPGLTFFMHVKLTWVLLNIFRWCCWKLSTSFRYESVSKCLPYLKIAVRIFERTRSVEKKRVNLSSPSQCYAKRRRLLLISFLSSGLLGLKHLPCVSHPED